MFHAVLSQVKASFGFEHVLLTYMLISQALSVWIA